MQDVFHSLADAARQGEKVVLAIIASVKGSSPQKLGAKALFYSDGRICGTVGGGCLEAEIQQRAVQALHTGKPAEFDLLLDHDFGWDDGLICGGKVAGVILPDAQANGAEFWLELELRESEFQWGVDKEFRIRKISRDESPQSFRYVESVVPPCPLWIAGAGHVAQAVAPLAMQLDFAVTVFDDRPNLASPRFFPTGVKLRSDAWEKLLQEPLPSRSSFGLIVTRGHRHDALVLKDWIRKPFTFLGMIGSKRKARTIFDHFLAEKIATNEQLQHVACPVGIEIDSQTVPEIAVSIMAQFIQKRVELVYGQRSSSSRISASSVVSESP